MIRKRERKSFEQPAVDSLTVNEVEIQTKIKQASSYKQVCIDTLNLLESRGINIYDENRFGGMYLRQNKNHQIGDLFKKEKSTKDESVDIKYDVQLENNELSDFFKQ